MTETIEESFVHDNSSASRSGDIAAERHRRRRHAANVRLKLYGLAAIGIAVLLLVILFGSLIHAGAGAFVQTHATFPVLVDSNKVDTNDPANGNYRSVLRESFFALFPEVTGPKDKRALAGVLSSGAQYQLRDMIVDNPDLIGQTIEFSTQVADPIDQFHKGTVLRETPEDRRIVSDQEIKWYDSLASTGHIESKFNWTLFFSADSRFPELAGLAGALTGSFYALLVCFLISFPVGISAAIYLEEFAPKNRWTEIIEVNINNLAAVPSVVFGLLGLAVFIQFFGLPRSAPLVGGMVLSLMTLPTIIIATRAALKAVPPSIREAALGVGASKHQVILHHVLPLAMPGILTGTIIGLAQALGETAPLLLIGMNAFITSDPGGLMDPATSLPTQVFIWADSPERGFVARTSAAILVLLGFLIFMNALAVVLRKKFERRW
ncbi:MAG: phosphate ABC transporter permease PstA [Rhodospirillales bacterium]